MNETNLRVDILGTALVLSSSSTPEHLQQVADSVRIRVDQLKSELATRDPVKLALLTALNLADELIRNQQKETEGKSISIDESSAIDSLTAGMIRRIEECLGED